MTERDEATVAGLGGTVAGRIAGHLQRAVAQTRMQLAPHQAAVAQQILRDFTNHVSDEVRGVMAPLWLAVAEHPDVPERTRDLARSLGTQRGQAWAWIGGQATSAAMGAGLIALLTNELQPVTGYLIRQNPHMPLAVADAAAADVRGVGWGIDLWTDAGQWGINQDRFNTIKRLHEAVPTPAEINEMLNRGILALHNAQAAYRRTGFAGEYVPEMIRLRERQPTMPDVAAMWNRGIVDTNEAQTLGRAEGVSDTNIARYLELGGEPPPIQELLLAWRRGVIDETQLDRALRQGPLRFEWIDVIKSMQWVPLSPVEAADAVLQGHMSQADGERIAAQSGVRAEDFDTVVTNAGLPPGVEFMSEALNRGLITGQEFTAAFLESRLKNKYVPLYERMRYRPIPAETVRRLYRLGALDTAEAAQRLQHTGFSPDDAAVMLSAETIESMEGTRELTKTEIVALYESRAVDQAQAQEMLTTLGYGANETVWILGIADSRRERKYVEATITRMRAGYVAYRLSESDVSALMDGLLIPPDQRDELIALWDLERLAVTRGLTVAQIQTAIRRGLITPDDGHLRFMQAGYSAEDAQLLVQLTGPAPR